MELGLVAKSDKRIVVVCEEGFWRKGNVDILCAKYKIMQRKNLEDGLIYLLNQ